ncbi:hypothetical protein K438DRAFT_1753443 [Mycena galopus ATCC 62051]|nr:hypothetical protein K438DRAFT_1753443 [Mycena galopus ATCC 62051]
MSRGQLYQTKLDGYFRLRDNPVIDDPQNGPFLPFEGKDWYVDSGSSTSPVDVEWRAYLRANAASWTKERNEYHAQGKTVDPKVYECGICWDTLAKPVVEAPIRDGAFETELDTAIGFGVVAEAAVQRQAGGYDWAGILFKG